MTERTSDDMDLSLLVERTITFLRRYGLLLISFSVFGIILGYVAFKIMPKEYRSTLLLHSYSLTNTEQINIIENWNELLKEKEYLILSQRLNCSPQIVRQVNKLSASETQKLYIPNNPNGFIVTALVKDKNILDSLQRGILFGLENSEYMKLRLQTRKDDLNLMIEKVNTEINKLDSLKNKLLSGNSVHSSTYILDVSNLNQQTINLDEKIIGYQNELKFISGAQVLHKFETFSKPSSPKLFKSLVLGFLFGSFLGYMVSLFLYYRTKLKGRV